MESGQWTITCASIPHEKLCCFVCLAPERCLIMMDIQCLSPRSSHSAVLWSKFFPYRRLLMWYIAEPSILITNNAAIPAHLDHADLMELQSLWPCECVCLCMGVCVVLLSIIAQIQVHAFPAQPFVLHLCEPFLVECNFAHLQTQQSCSPNVGCSLPWQNAQSW